MCSGVPVTQEQWQTFLGSLATCGNVTQACRDAGIARMTAYARRAADGEEEFGSAWAIAAAMGAEGLEDEARRRAFDGWDEPITFKGAITEHVTKYSDTLLIFLLKGSMPDKYKDRVATQLSGGIGVDSDFDLSTIPADDLRTVHDILKRATPPE